jgi:hypothetical protein
MAQARNSKLFYETVPIIPANKDYEYILTGIHSLQHFPDAGSSLA